MATLGMAVAARAGAQEESGGAAPASAAPPAPPAWSSAAPSDSGAGAGVSLPAPGGTGAGTPSTGGFGGVGAGAGAPSGTTEAPASTAPPPSLNLPGGYGFSGATLTGGQGRFTQPLFRFTVSASVGYDDNIFNTPTEPAKFEVPEPDIEIVERIERVPTGVPGVFFRRVVREEKEVQRFVGEIPEPPERIGSLVTNFRVGVQLQGITPRTALVVDASAGIGYYWDRPEDPSDESARLGLSFIHRLLPRLTVATQVDAVYQSQPDFSRINAPTNITGGNYLSVNAKLDLTYQMMPRLGVVGTYAYNSTLLEENETSSYHQHTQGLQLRFTVSPRITLTSEYRHSTTTYPDAPLLDSTGNFFLIGGEFLWSARLRTTISFGEEFREYTVGGSQATPYLESTTALLFWRGSILAWSNRYGFEEGGGPTIRRSSYRTSLGLSQVLTSRATARVGFAYNRVSVEDTLNPDIEEVVEQQIQLTLGMQFVLSSAITLSADYTFIQLLSTLPNVDYYRNQFYIGFIYTF